MLTHTSGSFQLSPHPSVNRHAGATPAVGVHRTTVRQVFWFALYVLLAGGILAGTIALKTLAFVWRLHA
jgi:hypothetical protein